MAEILKKKTINPFSKKDLLWLAKKWELNVCEVKDLMGVTGSSQLDVLENHLRKTGLWKK